VARINVGAMQHNHTTLSLSRASSCGSDPLKQASNGRQQKGWRNQTPPRPLVLGPYCLTEKRDSKKRGKGGEKGESTHYRLECRPCLGFFYRIVLDAFQLKGYPFWIVLATNQLSDQDDPKPLGHFPLTTYWHSKGVTETCCSQP
jgi:hypothetical protein